MIALKRIARQPHSQQTSPFTIFVLSRVRRRNPSFTVLQWAHGFGTARVFVTRMTQAEAYRKRSLRCRRVVFVGQILSM